MFDRTSTLPGTVAKGSAISQGLSLLGSAVGFAVALLATPLVFALTKQPLGSYFAGSYGPEIGSGLTYLMGCLEFLLIFVGTKLVLSIAATSAIVALAARRIPFA
jgi:hypothetical protein